MDLFSNVFTFLFQYILPFVIIISVIVFVHEFGHFITAKHFGVFCGEFSIGMGPLLWSKQGKETQYSIRAIPIGGYVSMAGEADDTKKDVDVPFERTILGIAPWKRIVVMLAGIFMNIILAWIIFIGLSMATGVAPVNEQPVFAKIVENSAAEKAGFEAGDIIVSLKYEDGRIVELESVSQLTEEIALYHDTCVYTVNRDGKLLDITATPEKQEDGTYILGVSIATNYREIKWYESFYYGTMDMLDSSTLIVKSLSTLFVGKNWDQVSGPVGIVSMVGETVSNGFLSFMNLMAVLSLNIGIFNAIPIPALDGGRAVITFVEMVSGKTVSEKMLEKLIVAGFILLLGVMLFATLNDVLKLIY